MRDYIHVSDLAAAHLAALDYLNRGGETLTVNCGYGRGYSVREVIDCVGRLNGAPLKVTEAPRRPGDPGSLIAEASLIREVFDWQPRHDSLERIVDSSLAWERRMLAGEV